MQKMIVVFISFFLCPLTANAQDLFEWPESFTVTDSETHPGTDDPPFINTYHKQGRNARNDIMTPNHGVKVDLFRFEGEQEGYREIKVHTDGTITEERHPADWPQSNMFPRDGIWKLIGKDTVNGQPAFKYSIDSDPAKVAACKKYCSGKVRHTFLWLSPDLKTPLRFADDSAVYNAVVDFTNYSVGPQDPKLFEIPGNKP